MGADIYLRSVNDPCQKEWEPKFKAAVSERDAAKSKEAEDRAQAMIRDAYDRMYAAGYYRDCYNGYGFFAQTELSWWQDVEPMLNKKGFLPITKARKLRALVAGATINPARAERVAAEQKDTAPEGGWQQHYEKDRKELLALIDKSIELGEPLYCSI